MGQRRQLQEELLSLSEQEKQRLGEEIHDGLCQDIAAASILCSVLSKRLETISERDARELQEIIDLLNSIMLQAKELAWELNPVHFDQSGLMAALGQLTRIVNRSIPCEFLCPHSVFIPDKEIALNLYRIAQEAVACAIKHSKPSRILIRLRRKHQKALLEVNDDGREPPPGDLRILKYHARNIHALLRIVRHPNTGTKITCSVAAEGTGEDVVVHRIRPPNSYLSVSGFYQA